MTTSTTAPTLLSDLQNTTDQIHGGSWLTGDLSIANTALGGLGNVTNPLMSVAEAGFAFVMPLIEFLGEPLKLLAGDPGAVTSTTQTMTNTGQSVSALSGNYQQAAAAQTTGWSGPAADGYQGTSAQQATGQAALGQASHAVSGATNGGALAVAQTLAEVTALIAQATTQIITILTTAASSSEATFGGSWAEAIPHVIAVAATCAAQVAAKLATLLSSAQNLSGLVQQVMSAVQSAGQLLTQFTQSSGNTSTPATNGATV